jgi:hypothetical protein
MKHGFYERLVLSRCASYVGSNNLEFKVRNLLLGYKGSIYIRWRLILQCRRLDKGLGRRLERGIYAACTNL